METFLDWFCKYSRKSFLRMSCEDRVVIMNFISSFTAKTLKSHFVSMPIPSLRRHGISYRAPEGIETINKTLLSDILNHQISEAINTVEEFMSASASKPRQCLPFALTHSGRFLKQGQAIGRGKYADSCSKLSREILSRRLKIRNKLKLDQRSLC